MFPCLAALLLACSSNSPTGNAGVTSNEAFTRLEIRNSRGELVRLDVEVADTEPERELGLSNRDSLDRDSGMLFVYTQRLGLWMKDTYVPLSAAFIAPCGEIVAIVDMEPQSLQIHQTDRDYAFGLEVNQGWFESRGITVGSMVTIPAQYRKPGCG